MYVFPEYIHSQPSPRCCSQLENGPHSTNTTSTIEDSVVGGTGSVGGTVGHHNNILFDYKLSRGDSGTSSPQPLLSETTTTKQNLFLVDNHRLFQNRGTPLTSGCSRSSGGGGGGTSGNKISVNVEIIDQQQQQQQHDDDSDSTDSVFSSGSSSATDDLNMFEFKGANSSCVLRSNAIRDIYLGGSCMERTKWRQEFAIPCLKEKNISYYLSDLHESIEPSVTKSRKRIQIKNGPSSAEHDKKTNQDEQQREQHHNIEKDYEKGEGEPNRQHHQTEEEEQEVVAMEDEESHSQNNLSLVENTLVEYGMEEEDVGSETQNHMFNPKILDSSRVLFFLITNETRSLAPMTLAAHYIGLGYNVVLCVQMLPEINCTIQNEIVGDVFIFIFWFFVLL